MASATLLLPERARLAGGLPPDAGAVLARSDASQRESGERAQLRRHFQLVPDHWPCAALTRQLDAGDAGTASWLRVDPAHVAPDMGGARMLAYGEDLAPTAEDAAQLLPALKPIFGDAGFLLDAPQPSRWYLQSPPGARMPEFSEPAEVLGDDLFAHLPQGEPGRRWRALLSEAQVVLHNHPWNAVRRAQGKLAINSVWFWGPGVLPDFVRTRYRQIKGNDLLLRSLARMAGVHDVAEPEAVDALVDLRHLRQAGMFARDALLPLVAILRARELDTLTLDFADGMVFELRAAQRWRLWRRPLVALDG